VRGKHRKPSRTRRVLLGALAATAASGIIVILSATFADTIAMGATSGSGVGVQADPVCAPKPLTPGQSSTVGSGLLVVNDGSATETITIAVQPVPAGTKLYGHGLPVPPAWVTVRHQVTLPAPDGGVTLPVQVTPPARARPGVYVASLEASAAGAAGQVSFGTGAVTYLEFTIGITKPSWPAALQGYGCWAVPGGFEPWQEFSGTPYATPPPGWYWQGPVTGDPAGAWVYDPPRGWYYSWVNPDNPGQVYRGGPARPCITAQQAAGYNNTFPPGPGGAWIGGHGYPDTSTLAGCEAWLAASRDGKLTSEPSLPGSATAPRPLPGTAPVPAQAVADRAPAKPSNVDGWVAFAAMVAVAVIVIRWFMRRRAR
jgi:hypothetical protein